MTKFLTVISLLAAATASLAQDVEDTIRKSLATLAPNLTVDSIKPSPIEGYQEVMAGSLLVYVSNDGKYLLDGQLIEVATRRNLTEGARSVIRKNQLDAVPETDLIAFDPEGETKHTITVFTDIDCGYCRKLHQEMKQYNDLGIAVHYMFFPRSGIGSNSYDKAVSVWCADDATSAMTLAKSGAEPTPKVCTNPVEAHYELGKGLGVTGTPALFTEDGTLISGYVPAADLLMRLDQMAAPAPAS